MATFTPNAAVGGLFEADAGAWAIARTQITTAAPSDDVTLAFDIARRPLWFRVGTTAGGQEIVADTLLYPGEHVMTFAPGASPYFVEFQLREIGEAALDHFRRVTAGALSLTTPWAEADMGLLRTAQNLDVQWWFHSSYEPRVLERRGDNSWSLRLFRPPDGPFELNDTSGFTLTPDARDGTATVTASGPVFVAADAGSLLRLTQSGQYESATGAALNDVTESIEVKGQDANRIFTAAVTGVFTATVTLQRSVGNELSWVDIQSFTGPTSIQHDDGLDDQSVFYRLKVTAYTSGSPVMTLIYAGGVTNGVCRIHTVDADNAVTVDVLEPFGSLDPTQDWARGAWSARSGWPACGAFREGRLAIMRGDRYWMSVPGSSESFLEGPMDGDAVARSIPGRMNFARWAASSSALFVGMTGGEAIIGSGAYDEVTTPANARARIYTEEGSSAVDAVSASGSPIWVHRSGTRVLHASLEANGYTVTDLTRLHRHIAGGVGDGVVSLAWQRDPEPRLWAIRSDGEAAVLLLNTGESLAAWQRLVPAGTDAAFQSVCVLPGAPEDHVYLVASRYIDDEQVRYVEKLAVERWDEPSEAWRLQSGSLYSGASATTLTGLGHLEGEAVHVWGNGRLQGPFTVSSGSITLDYAVTYAIVGLKYEGRYQSPRLPGIAQQIKPDRIGLAVHRTARGLLAWGRDFDNLNYIADREYDGAYDAPLELYTADVEYPFEGSMQRDSRVCIVFTGGGPATVLALTIEGQTGR